MTSGHGGVPVSPTGEQFVLTRGNAEVTVVQVGGGLRSYRSRGRELLDGFAETEPADDFRGQVLAPWPKRITDGRYTRDGIEYRLPVTEPERGSALHGLVRVAAWTVVARGDDRVELEYLLHSQPGYPFTLRLHVAYALASEGLQVTTTATNEDDTLLPYSEGHHPYLSAGAGGRLDHCTLTAPARTQLVSDDQLPRTHHVAVDGSAFDLRAGRTIGDLRLDTAFTDLERDADGLA